MEMNRPQDDADAAFYEVKVEADKAKRIAGDAERGVREGRIKYDRAQRMLYKAKKNEAAALTKEDDARGRAAEAKRRAEEATRRGESRHRWESEARRWEGEARRLSAHEFRRWTDEARRKELELRTLARELEQRRAGLGEKLKEADAWQKRLAYVALHGRLSVEGSSETGGEPAVSTDELAPAGEPSTPSGQPSDVGEASTLGRWPQLGDSLGPLSVTERATGALMDVLGGMEHGPYQMLRLVAQPGGGIGLILDAERQGDHVVSHQGVPVLLVEDPVPESLRGAVVDVSESAWGLTLVLSR